MVDPFQRVESLREISDVNVVPLADVSLVLLIILLVLSPMMTQSMLRVQAAGRSQEHAAETAQTPQEAPQMPQEVVLVVALTPRGIFVGDRSFAGPGEFMSFMVEELGKRSDKKVFVTAHPDTSHGMVVHMLEMLKGCGASSVALIQTQDEQAEAPAVAGAS